jgi:hypothetical protein
MSLEMLTVRGPLGLLAVVALASGLVCSGPVEANPSQVQRDLATLRNATAAFHDIDNAIAAGWTTDITGCMEGPDGGMGHHYANFDALFDGGQLEVARPEALLYEPQANGQLRLVAVEYVILESDLARTEPAPVLLGQPFSFNPHAEVWALHVWIWLNNPSGMFADWNPRVSCEFAQ